MLVKFTLATPRPSLTGRRTSRAIFERFRLMRLTGLVLVGLGVGYAQQLGNPNPIDGSLKVPNEVRHDLDLPFIDSRGELWFSRLQQLKESETARAQRLRRDRPGSVPTVVEPLAEGTPLTSDTPRSAGVQHVKRIADYSVSTNTLLYLTSCDSALCLGSSLWTFDGLHQAKLYDGVLNAYIHPRAISVVIWTVEHEVFLIRPIDGTVIMRVPGHAAAPVFSQDGRFLAYEKLADSSPSGDKQDLFEFSPGIAILDLSSGVERLVTHDSRGNDFEPVAFSLDNQVLLFNSTRDSGVASLWAVGVDKGDIRKVTNNRVQTPDITPILSQRLLWSTDSSIAISLVGGEIWRYDFAVDWNVTRASHIGGGDSIYWLAQNETLMVGNGGHWKALAIQEKGSR
jgi:hypothetical protein